MAEAGKSVTERMRDRMAAYKTDAPGAGEPFPDLTLGLLDGSERTLSSLQGKAVVIQTGAYT
jgi:hypothetical protein